LKVLFFTGDGTIILYKHLERGTFEPLRAVDNDASPTSSQPCLTLSVDELRLLLEGIELSSVKRRARWRREQPKLMANTSSKVPLTENKK
jgi:hypothetical protein